MKKLLAATFGLLALPALAQETCTLPGELLAEDPAGDAGLQAGVDALPMGQDDLLALYAAEPSPGKLVFTVKLGGLDPLPPAYRWVVYFVGPGQETTMPWVALTTADPPFTARFTYGVSSVPTESTPLPLRAFEEQGTLDAESNYAADGTITLVVDKAAVGLPESGAELYGVLASARRSTPDTVMAAGLTVDRVPESDAFYELKGASGCGKAAGLGSGSGAAGGGLDLLTLLALGCLGLRRRTA